MQKNKYYRKYIKYKNDYLETKQNRTVDNDYKFIEFDNMLSQKEFIKNNLNRIVDLMMGCFGHGLNSANKKEYYNNTYNLINILSDITKWFFIMSKNIIIGICYEDNPDIIYSDKQLETYKIININFNQIKKLESNVIHVNKYIGGFCKDPNYKMVGSFLLNEISKNYKNNGIDIFYLTPESTIYKNNYLAIKGDECVLKNYDYLLSNKKLIKYYEKNGFVIDKHLYEIIECNESDKFIFLNVMFKKL